MKNMLLIILCLAFISGCTGRANEWHSSRLNELQTAYESGEISKKEFLDMKLRLDEMYIDATKRNTNSGHVWVHNAN